MENIIDIVRTVANKNDIEIAYINNAAQLRVNYGNIKDIVATIEKFANKNKVYNSSYSIEYNNETSMLTIKNVEVENKLTREIVIEFCNEHNIKFTKALDNIAMYVGKDAVLYSNIVHALKIWAGVKYGISINENDSLSCIKPASNYIAIFKCDTEKKYETKLTKDIIMNTVYNLRYSFKCYNDIIEIKCNSIIDFVVEITEACRTIYGVCIGDIKKCLSYKENIIIYERK